MGPRRPALPRLPRRPGRRPASATPTRRWPTPSPSRPARCCTSPTCSAPSRAARWPRTLDRLLGGGGQVFFSNSGAEANECAIKLARKWGGRGRHVVVSALRLVPRPHPGHAPRHRPARRSTRPSSRCPRASATSPGTTSTRSSAALDPTVAAVLLEPVQGEGGVNPATAEYFAGRPPALRRAGPPVHGRRGADRPRPHRARGSATSTSASCPTSSPWPRRSATACPSAPAGPGRDVAGGVRARRPRHHLRRPAARRRRGPGGARGHGGARTCPRRADAAGRAAHRRRCSTLPRVADVRGLGLLLAAELADGLDAKAVAAAALDAGLVVNAVTPDRAAPRPAAARLRRRDRRGASRSSAAVVARAEAARMTGTSSRSTTSPPTSCARCSTWPSARRRRRSSPGKGVALLFEKPSARTRNSMEMAVVQLGGHPVTIRPDEVGLDTRETVEDVARTLACYHAVIGARVFEHAKLERMAAVGRGAGREPAVRRRPPAAGAGRPAHDRRASSATLDGRTLAYVGDGNNVARSLALAAGHARHGRCASPARRATACPTPTSTGIARTPASSRTCTARSRRGRRRAPTSSTPTSGRRWARRTRPTLRREAFEGFTVDDALHGRGRDRRASSCTACPPTGARRSPTRCSTGRRSRVWLAGREPHARRPRACWPGSSTRAATDDAGDTAPTEAGQDPAPAPRRQAARAARRAATRTQLVDLLAAEGVRRHPGHRVARPRRPGRHQGAGAGRRVASTPSPSCPKEQRAPEDHLRRVFGDWVVEVGALGQPRRAAHAAGLGPRGRLGARPGRRCPTILGTVAGDDTLIVVVAEGVGGAERRRPAARPRRPLIRPTRPNRPTDRATRRKNTMAKRVVLAYSGGLDTSVAVRWMIEELGVEVDRRGRRRRPGRRRLGRRARSGPAPPAPSRPSSSTPARSSPTTSCAPALKANALVRGPLPAGVGPVPAGHREAPRRGGPRARRRRGGPRLHRQGQRPGPLRGVHPGPRPRPRGHRPGPRLGHDPRGRRSTTPTDHDIPITATKEKVYSIDDNLWGRAIECGEMEDPWAVPPDGRVVADQADRDRAPRRRRSASSRACRSSVDGEALGDARRSSTELNDVVGAYGWGRIDMVENRRVGIKSRETYECPAAPGADHGPQGPRVDLPRARPRPREGPARAPLRRARLRRPVVLAAEAGARRVRRRRASGSSPARCGCASSPAAASSSGGAATHSLYDYGLATYDAADTLQPRGLRRASCASGASASQTWAATPGPERPDRRRRPT